ncbi:MAG: hypothetical protein HQL13_05980 [Candidatus Omnitrophica bacterium]|nr:hypothetical protein [Candidatus Omnitrophota bacterium]
MKFYRFCRILVSASLICNSVFFTPGFSLAQSVLNLPPCGQMVHLSPSYEPVMMRGLTVHKDNPFLFDFILDRGQDMVSGVSLRKMSEKQIKYFLASLAIPDHDVWVNLSPYERNKIIPQALGRTDMGRDLLEEDYILKQLTASLIYPEKDLGRQFWDEVYRRSRQIYGEANIPINTFNKVWIMADEAQVYEHHQTVLVVNCHLKVMLEEDYLATEKTLQLNRGYVQDRTTKNVSPSTLPSKRALNVKAPQGNPRTPNSIEANIVREIILPALEKEINAGKHFSTLRQIFNAMILANWYKRSLRQALLNQFYTNQSKVKGIDIHDPSIKDRIYQQYLKAYQKGVFNYIKEDINAANGKSIPRKYFSGGVLPGKVVNADKVDASKAMPVVEELKDRGMDVMTEVVSESPPEQNKVDAIKPPAAEINDKKSMLSKIPPSEAINQFLRNEYQLNIKDRKKILNLLFPDAEKLKHFISRFSALGAVLLPEDICLALAQEGNMSLEEFILSIGVYKRTRGKVEEIKREVYTNKVIYRCQGSSWARSNIDDIFIKRLQRELYLFGQDTDLLRGRIKAWVWVPQADDIALFCVQRFNQLTQEDKIRVCLARACQVDVSRVGDDAFLSDIGFDRQKSLFFYQFLVRDGFLPWRPGWGKYALDLLQDIKVRKLIEIIMADSRMIKEDTQRVTINSFIAQSCGVDIRLDDSTRLGEIGFNQEASWRLFGLLFEHGLIKCVSGWVGWIQGMSQEPTNVGQLRRYVEIGMVISQIVSQNGKNSAMSPHRVWNSGGIDLNTSSSMRWKINREGDSVEMNLNQAMMVQMERQDIEYLAPKILKITPLSPVWVIQ